MVDLIELLFFAYRVHLRSRRDSGEVDFGARITRLHFVDRNPGLTVADLLDILKITKQSLARVLKELIEAGFIEQRTGLEDRRQRLLYATPAGQALSAGLSSPQERRIKAALLPLGPEARATVTAFLFGMINATRMKAASWSTETTTSHKQCSIATRRRSTSARGATTNGSGPFDALPSANGPRDRRASAAEAGGRFRDSPSLLVVDVMMRANGLNYEALRQTFRTDPI